MFGLWLARHREADCLRRFIRRANGRELATQREFVLALPRTMIAQTRNNESAGFLGLGFQLGAAYLAAMLSRSPSGLIEPCLPSPGDRPPDGPNWVHEIKHDGYRLMARRDPIGILLITRGGHDWRPTTRRSSRR